MFVTQLRAGYWRSWPALALDSAAQWNIFSGNNGAGKTAILESLWALHRQRSLRGQKLRTIRSAFCSTHDSCFTRVHFAPDARAYDSATTAALSIDDDGSTQARLADSVVSKAQLSRAVPMVAIQPLDTELILGASDHRREYVHRIAFSLMPDFLTTLRMYEHALLQRNSLLRDTNLHGRELYRALAAWDETFCTQAANLQAAILKAFSQICTHSAGLLTQFMDGRSVSLVDVENRDMAEVQGDPTQPVFWENLVPKWIEKDRRKGYTSVGPHRWDWEARLEGISAKQGASYGQVRAITLALRLAAADIMALALSEPPLILLDDLNSELDISRRRMLLQGIAERGYQSWITTTEADQVPVPAGLVATNWLVADQSLKRQTQGNA